MPRATTQIKKKKAPTKRRSKIESGAPLVSTVLTSEPLVHGHSSHDDSARVRSAHEEKNQKLIMWIGISSIMTLIVVLWIMNLNHIVDAEEILPRKSENQNVDFGTLKKDLSETLSKVKDDIKQLNQPTTVTSTAVPETTPITNTAQPNTLPN
jgi:hypothetical protein